MVMELSFNRGPFRESQALPYCWTLLFVPMHFMTFELLLLATGLWTTNIHDTVDGKV